MADELPSPDPDELETALGSLCALERQVLLLAARDKLRTDAIAERMGITPQRVERLLARALRKLDRALERPRRPWWRFW